MMTWGHDGSPPRVARTIGCMSVFTTSTLKPIDLRSSETKACDPCIPSLNFESVETLGKRMNSFSFSTGSNMRPRCAMPRRLPIPNRPRSVPEMAYSREHHRHSPIVGGLDDLVVADRAPGLYGCRRAGLGGRDQPVRKREEGLADDHAALEVEARLPGLPHGDPGAVDARHLARADPERLLAAAVDDRIRLHVLADLPAEQHRVPLLGRRLAPR